MTPENRERMDKIPKWARCGACKGTGRAFLNGPYPTVRCPLCLGDGLNSLGGVQGIKGHK